MLDIAIIGAGPYGLSIGAHLNSLGTSFRIFGRPMDSWRDHMPKGMRLKSDGFASNLYAPAGKLTLQDFCAERGIEYHHTDVPVRLDTFCNYGQTFRERLVPNLEETNVTKVVRLKNEFLLTLETGEEVKTKRLVLAIGITHFKHTPSLFEQLGSEHVTHSYQHHDLETFRGRHVIVVGGGASAIELSGLLHEAGADVQLVSRRKELVFHNPPKIGQQRSLWKRLRHPRSGLGPGMSSYLFSNFPSYFRNLPEETRLRLVRTTLGPSAGWTSRKQVMGKVPLLLGMTPESVAPVNGAVRLKLQASDGSSREVDAEHIITGTGYKVDLNRLQFLSPEIKQNVALLGRSPVLSSTFESSVPGLYFVGLAAANTFGPLMRFAFGAGFAAERISKAVGKSNSKAPVTTRTARPATSAENERISAL
jgi:Pyridine nucleotide-disulphide oxidoreductase